MPMTYKGIESNLLIVLNEIASQSDVGDLIPAEYLKFDAQIDQIREYIGYAGEYGLAYECMVVLLEEYPFLISGSAAIRLLEVGLIMGFKTDRVDDAGFDKRSSGA